MYFYFLNLNVSFHSVQSLFGFLTFLFFFNQVISGVMLSFSFIPEPMIVPLVRDEEDVEDLYIDDFFWLHERGVDLIFVFVFLHLFRKLYLHIIDNEQEYSWKSGVFTFLFLQIVVFFGLVLCCTHLSEVTLTIAANALQTALFSIGKAYWWVFTDRTLNTDTIIRLAYGHYVSAFFLVFLAVIHGIDMHYDWKDENTADGIFPELNWWDEALSSEVLRSCELIFLFWFITSIIYAEPEALSYEIFMWGDVGIMTDVRFYGVAPHWYFRPYMSWLVVCPFHKIGLIGLIYFFVILYFQPNLVGFSELQAYITVKVIITKFIANAQNQDSKLNVLKWQRSIVELCLSYSTWYAILLVAVACSLSFLPYGRFYNRLGGDFAMFFSFMYIFVYLGLNFFRYSIMLTAIKLNLI